MNPECPVLMFVRGPQQGQRVLLNRPVLVLGRGGGSDVMLSEDFASRQQARYELLQAGPTLENLSDKGTWINGKRYKAGKRVLLETGDLIGAGRETEILFVAAGDDPDAALATYEAHAATGRNAFGKKPKGGPELAEPQPMAEQDEPALAEAAETPRQAKARKRRPSEMSTGERVQADEGARRRKIVIALGIYLGVMVVVALLLKLFLGAPAGKTRMPTMLTDEQIEDILAEIPVKTPNRLFMEERLERARGLYQQFGLESPKLYQCVHAFKQALAYSGRNFFENTEDEKAYRQALNRLTEKIRRRYRNAYLHEKSADWRKAEAAFRDLLAMLTLQDDVEKNLLFRNIQDHHKRCKQFMLKKAPGSRGPWM